MGRVGFWFRLVAALIDAAFFLPLWVGAMLAFQPSVAVADVVFYGGWLAYSSLEVIAAGTPGKIVLRLRIAKADGSAADRWTLFLRWSTKQLPAMASLLYAMTVFPPLQLLAGFTGLLVVIGCLFASTDSKRAWHDEWARTAVFRKPRKVVSPFGFPVLPPR